jgi:prepilin peptidase CpaA
MTTLSIVAVVPLLVLLAVAVCTDFRERRIPNALSLGGAALGFIVQATLLGPLGFASAALGWLLCLACFLPFYVTGGMAAGDVKLMAAVGAFLGPLYGFAACAATLVAGALVGVACLGWRSTVRAAASFEAHMQAAELRGDSERESGPSAGSLESDLRAKIPYAGVIALGTAFVASQPELVLAVLTNGSWLNSLNRGWS